MAICPFLVLSACSRARSSHTAKKSAVETCQELRILTHAQPPAQLVLPIATNLEDLDTPSRHAMIEYFSALADAASKATSQFAEAAGAASASDAAQRIGLHLDRETQTLRATTTHAQRATQPEPLDSMIRQAFSLQRDWDAAANRLGATACSGAFGPASVGFVPRPQPVAVTEHCYKNSKFHSTLVNTGIDIAASAKTLARCDQPHDYEIYASFQYPAGPTVPYPGDVTIARYGAEECQDRIEALAGDHFLETNLGYISSGLGQHDWTSGERTMFCELYDLSGKPFKSV